MSCVRSISTPHLPDDTGTEEQFPYGVCFMRSECAELAKLCTVCSKAARGRREMLAGTKTVILFAGNVSPSHRDSSHHLYLNQLGNEGVRGWLSVSKLCVLGWTWTFCDWCLGECSRDPCSTGGIDRQKDQGSIMKLHLSFTCIFHLNFTKMNFR
jgi:hypothetical protein